MQPFHRLGRYIITHWMAIHLFFCFIGHLVCTLFNVPRRKAFIAWRGITETLYNSGARLVIPIVFISALVAVTIEINVNNFLGRYNLQLKAMHLLQNMLTMDVIPFFIASILCVQSSFSLMNLDKDKLYQQPQETLEQYIIPTMIGLSLCGVLLYVYILTTFWLMIYFSILLYLQIPTTEFFLALVKVLTPMALVYALAKTLVYAMIASLILGYYYYQVAVHQISLRLALSRIIARGLFFLALASLLIKLGFY